MSANDEFSQMWYQYILDNPEKEWDWICLVKNPNINNSIIKQIIFSNNDKLKLNLLQRNHKLSWEDIKTIVKDLKCNLCNVSKFNHNITWENVKESSQLFPSNRNFLEDWFKYNQNVGKEILQGNIPDNIIRDNIVEICSNNSITWNMVKNFITPEAYPWVNLSRNPNITWENIEEAEALGINLIWDWEDLSRNPNMTWDIIERDLASSNPKKWSFENLTTNPSITLDNIKSNPQYPWRYICYKTNITWEIVKEDLESPNPIRWNWKCLFERGIMTWENVKELWNILLEKDLIDQYRQSRRDASYNPNITWENIQEDLASSKSNVWFFNHLSENPNITWEIIKEDLLSSNPKSWDFYKLSDNPSITWENVKESEAMFPDKKWAYMHLSRNTMSVWRSKFV
jgi:hypothetical protein